MSLHLILDCLNRERVRCTYGAVGAVIGESARGVSRHLEALSGDRRGQHAIRINDQWRICFVWRKGEAWSVEIVDYH